MISEIQDIKAELKRALSSALALSASLDACGGIRARDVVELIDQLISARLEKGKDGGR